MRKNLLARATRLWLAVAVGGCVVGPGCDGTDNKTEMVKPDVPPEVKAKESMDAYLKNMQKGKGAPTAPKK